MRRILIIIKCFGVRNLLLKIFNKRFRKVYPFKNSFYDIHKNASVFIEKQFSFNVKWSNHDHRSSLLIMRKNSKLIVKDFNIYSGAQITINQNAELILNTGYINHNVNISCFEKIQIGNNVAISENVTIRDSDNHKVSNSNIVKAPIIIEDDVWIGGHVIIMPGLTIKKGTIIGAGSIVTKNFPEYSIIGGNPAKFLKSRLDA